MSKKALIFWPRLDCTFKEGPCDSSYPFNPSDLPPIRKWWHQFLLMLEQGLIATGHEIVVVHKPLWQMKPEDAIEHSPDIVYVPHRLPEHFPLPKTMNPRYYMQTVLPWLFSVSPHGWGARLEPAVRDRVLNSDRVPMADAGAIIRKCQQFGLSKFPQAKRQQYPDTNYILFVCQLPHDDTIRYFSEISVIDALARTSEIARQAGVPLVVKGHIANPASQLPLMHYAQTRGHKYILGEWNILDLMQNARAVFSVNSGTTIEAMAMGKLVYRFGDAEYNYVVPSALYETLTPEVVHTITQSDYRIDFGQAYSKWLDSWYSLCMDTSNGEGCHGLRF